MSVKAVTGKPIKFAGMGEKLEDLEVFHPDRMASRILGMGDVLTLIEDAQNKMDQKKAKQMAQKMMSNKFDFNDLNEQFEQIKKMGPLKGIIFKNSGGWANSLKTLILTTDRLIGYRRLFFR